MIPFYNNLREVLFQRIPCFLFSPGRYLPFFLLLTISRVLSLAFTIAIAGPVAMGYYAILLLLLFISESWGAATRYNISLCGYIKWRGVSSLLSRVIRSLLTTVGRVIYCQSSMEYCIFRGLAGKQCSSFEIATENSFSG